MRNAVRCIYSIYYPYKYGALIGAYEYGDDNMVVDAGESVEEMRIIKDRILRNIFLRLDRRDRVTFGETLSSVKFLIQRGLMNHIDARYQED